MTVVESPLELIYNTSTNQIYTYLNEQLIALYVNGSSLDVCILHLNGLSETEYLTGISITGSSQFNLSLNTSQEHPTTIYFEVVDPVWNPESTITLSLTIETNENTYQTPLIINNTITGE